MPSGVNPPFMPPSPQESREDREKDKQIKSLVAALKRHKDELPPDLQNLVKEVTVRSGQEETKQLHSAVTQHGRAKKEVQDSQSARLHMHLAWKNFLAQSVKQWSSYTEHFLAQEKQLLDRLKNAQDALTAAKQNLGACKNAAGLAEDAAMISDAEETDSKETVEIAGRKIAASFQDLATNLENLHTQAEQAVQMEEEQDQLRKRPRMSAPEKPDAALDGANPPSFGAPE